MSNDDINANDDLDSQPSDGKLDDVASDSFDALNDGVANLPPVDDASSQTPTAEQLAPAADEAAAIDDGATTGEAVADSSAPPHSRCGRRLAPRGRLGTRRP